MTLAPGSRLGAYEIVGKLGAGGMGEVWRARDTRLDREVALKLLPAGFADDAERHARFEREAKLLASLNHPNIAHLYGLEHLEVRVDSRQSTVDSSAARPEPAPGSSGHGPRATGHDVERAPGALHVLVMELVEGEDLAKRLERGAIPVDEAIPIARQIAEALEAAHGQGIVHRDLKPANVKVRPDGTVKVLDFGLAKAVDVAARSDPSLSPTMTHAATQAGLILGTAAYMSPEQARGKTVDKRADIWAFGVVLWEMLTGRRLFGGETVSDVMAGVLRAEVDLDALPGDTPPAIRRLLRRCLERDQRSRIHDIADARIEIEQATRGVPETAAVPAAATGRRHATSRERVAWALAAVATVAAIAVLGLAQRKAPLPSQPTTRFRMLPAEAGTIEGYPALSPDGRTLAYVVLRESGSAVLCVHSFDSGASRELAGTEEAQEPFFSADGRQLAFFAKGRLKRFDLATGGVQEICAVADSRGGAWIEGGDIIATVNSASPLVRISPATGEVTPVSTLAVEQGAQSHRFPWPLPEGRVLFTVTGAPGVRGVYWASPGELGPRRLVADQSRAAYDERGYLLWVRQGALVAQRFDARRGELSGEPFPLAENVGGDSQKTGKYWFATSSAGAIAYRSGTRRELQLQWFDRGGRPLGTATAPGGFTEPTLSPDDRRIAVVLGTAGFGGDVWLYDAAAQDRGQRLTFGPSEAETPIWSPDGRWVAYSSARARGYALFRKAADGTGDEEHLLDTVQPTWPDSWSPDGRRILFERYESTGGSDLWLLPLDGERKAVPYLATAANESHAAISPDGRLVAYVSDETGVPQVYIQTLPPSGSKWQLTSDGGDMPAWRPDGREIFYVGLDRVLRAVPVVGLSPFAAGPPAALFRLRIPQVAITGNRTYFAATRDGRRFLINSLVGASDDPGIGMVMGWNPPGEEHAGR
jgi:Tol biopolymer transport system component